MDENKRRDLYEKFMWDKQFRNLSAHTKYKIFNWFEREFKAANFNIEENNQQGAIMDITAAMRNNSEISNLNTFNAEIYLK